MRFCLYLGYMRFVFFCSLYLLICTPTFAISSHVVFIFYIMANLGRGILNGKMSAHVEILFIFVHRSVYSGIYRTVL